MSTRYVVSPGVTLYRNGKPKRGGQTFSADATDPNVRAWLLSGAIRRKPPKDGDK